MQLPYVKITTTKAEIGIKSHRPDMEIKQRLPDIKMKSKPADVEYIKSDGVFEIDQKAAFKDANLMNILERNREWVEKSKQKYLQGLAKRAQQGDQMMKIENGFGAFQAISDEESRPVQKEFNIGYIPSTFDSVDIKIEAQKIKIKVTPHAPEISINPRKPEFKIHKWATDIYMKQKNSIKFEVVGNTFNKSY